MTIKTLSVARRYGLLGLKQGVYHGSILLSCSVVILILIRLLYRHRLQLPYVEKSITGFKSRLIIFNSKVGRTLPHLFQREFNHFKSFLRVYSSNIGACQISRLVYSDVTVLTKALMSMQRTVLILPLTLYRS
jgi:hypothetical protein